MGNFRQLAQTRRGRIILAVVAGALLALVVVVKRRGGSAAGTPAPTATAPGVADAAYGGVDSTDPFAGVGAPAFGGSSSSPYDFATGIDDVLSPIISGLTDATNALQDSINNQASNVAGVAPAAPASPTAPAPVSSPATKPTAAKYLEGLHRDGSGPIMFRNAQGVEAAATVAAAAREAIAKETALVKRTKKNDKFAIPGYHGTYFMNVQGSLERVS